MTEQLETTINGPSATRQDADDRLQDVTRGSGFLAAGGLLGALTASSCCILPLVLFSLGVGGAWIGNLAGLSPYQPIFVAITLGFLGAGFYLVYRRPKVACAEGRACARLFPSRLTKVGLWTATALVTAALAFPYVAPALLGV